MFIFFLSKAADCVSAANKLHDWWLLCVVFLSRRLWLPDLWGKCQSGRVDVLPVQWHRCSHRKSFYCCLCRHLLPHSTLLRQVRLLHSGCVSVCLLVRFSFNLFVARRAVVEGLWLRFQGEEVEVCVRRERRRRILQTLVWFLATLLLALFIPDIGRVISLIGGLAACFIFVFPGKRFTIFFFF